MIKCQKSNSCPHLEEFVSCIIFYWYIIVSFYSIRTLRLSIWPKALLQCSPVTVLNDP